jgi:hypothetical protein
LSCGKKGSSSVMDGHIRVARHIDAPTLAEEPMADEA